MSSQLEMEPTEILSKDNPGNLMNKAYEDPNFNVFDQGPVAFESSLPQNRRLVLKNVPVKLKHKAIEGMMGQFGAAVDVYIPSFSQQESFKEYKVGYNFVFVEFKTFAEAEKALRELNGVKNDGLNIRAEFAHERRQSQPDNEIQFFKPIPDDESDKEEKNEENSLHLPFNIQYDRPNDDVYEKVSQFERKNDVMSWETKKKFDKMKNLASKMNGNYNAETETYDFNHELQSRIPGMFMFICSQCDKEALLKCSATSRYFCSIKCSLLVDAVEEPMELNQILYSEPIKIKDRVVVTAVINEKCVYIRHLDCDDACLMNDVLKYSKTDENLQMYPEVGDLVLAKFNKVVYRARVLEVPDDEDSAISVHLIDYGNTARVFFADLFEMLPECQRLKCNAFKVFLKNVKIDAINWDIINYLENLVLKKIELALVFKNGSEVVLRDESLAVNVNEKIVQMSVVKEATYADYDGEIFSIEQSYSAIPLGRNKKVYVVNAKPDGSCPDVICCIAENYVKDFLEMYRAVNFYGNNRTSAETGIPHRAHEMVLVKCNDQWHRAVIFLTFGDGKPLCHLVDISSIQKIPVKDIIPMPKVFVNPPVLHELCRVEAADNNRQSLLEGKFLNVAEVEIDKNDDGTVVLRL